MSAYISSIAIYHDDVMTDPAAMDTLVKVVYDDVDTSLHKNGNAVAACAPDQVAT